MQRVGPYTFKRAKSEAEFEQIHRLNYRTFVAEIPQHTDTGNGRLIDKFHHKNAYFIALEEARLVGMLSVHDQPPFSIADRLSDPTVLQRPGMRPLEVRLLAVEPCKRKSTVFLGLIWDLYTYALEHRYSHLLISGFEDRARMYERLGFETLGPPVRCGDARFIPMMLTVGQIPLQIERTKQQWEAHLANQGGALKVPGNDRLPTSPHEVCLLPGPVPTSRAVREAFHKTPIYHRGPEFIALFRGVRQALGALVGGRDVALFNGSGTLANEVVAATLASKPRPGRGILLVNGEFGRRLASQAGRFGLQPRQLSWQWGRPWDLDEVAEALAHEPPGSWIWGVHLESSTGVLNNVPELVRLARQRGVDVCLDCISSLGAVPVDLRQVHLATGATGKSLGSYAGLAIVFASHPELESQDTSQVPSYFDLRAVLASEGPRFTFPSPTVRALEAALAVYATPQIAQRRYDAYGNLGKFVRQKLRQVGIEAIAREEWACPVVTTFAPPGDATSAEFVARCQAWGFAIGGLSEYLAERRLVQIATMGAVTSEEIAPLMEHLSKWLRPALVATAVVS